MFVNLDEDLLNLRIILDYFKNFKKFLENLINSFNCFVCFNKNLLLLIYFHY